MAKRSVDLWSHVQREADRDLEPARHVHVVKTRPAAPTVPLRSTEGGWHSPKYRDRASAQIAALESAVTTGRERKATRLRAAYLHTVHTDRVLHARRLAVDLDLRLDAMGRGPFCDRPTIHFRDRLPWGIFPLRSYGADEIPDRAADVVSTWNGHGEVFDRYYMAHEPPTHHFRTHSLIGAISPDGRTSDWFVLDRWAS